MIPRRLLSKQSLTKFVKLLTRNNLPHYQLNSPDKRLSSEMLQHRQLSSLPENFRASHMPKRFNQYQTDPCSVIQTLLSIANRQRHQDANRNPRSPLHELPTWHTSLIISEDHRTHGGQMWSPPLPKSHQLSGWKPTLLYRVSPGNLSGSVGYLAPVKTSPNTQRVHTVIVLS